SSTVASRSPRLQGTFAQENPQPLLVGPAPPRLTDPLPVPAFVRSLRERGAWSECQMPRLLVFLRPQTIPPARLRAVRSKPHTPDDKLAIPLRGISSPGCPE